MTYATWLIWKEESGRGKAPSSSNMCSLGDIVIFIGSETPHLGSPFKWKGYWGLPAIS